MLNKNSEKIRQNLSMWEDHYNKKKQYQQYAIKQHKHLYNKISYRDDPDAIIKKYNYSPQTLMPLVYFYKLLAHKPTFDQVTTFPIYKLILNIPDTIVYNDGDTQVMWFFTDQKGYVNRVDNIPAKQIAAKLTERADDNELVAILKKPYYTVDGLQGNQVKLLGSKQLKQTILNIGVNRGQINILQKYVKCNSVKPFIVRTAWKKTKPAECWVITSNYQYNSELDVPQIQKLTTVLKVKGACTTVKSQTGKFLEQTLVYVNNIKKYLLVNLDVQFQQLVIDFIKDEGGNWWYINTKSFILKQGIQKVFYKKITNYGQYQAPVKKITQKKKIQHYQKCKNCKYCNKVFPQHLMTHKLTLIMLLQADKHLLSRGKDFQWLQRCYTLHIGNVNLYIQHKVCDSCYKLYKQIQKLMELERQFAQLIGIPISQDNKNNVSITALPAFKGHPPKFGSRLQKNTYEQKMPENWGFPTQSQVNLQDLGRINNQNIKKYRLMILLHNIRDIPLDRIKNIGNESNTTKSHSNYYLQYNIFETRIKYKLDMEQALVTQNDYYMVQINKIRIFYFFILDRKHLMTFLKEKQALKIFLFQDQKKLGEVELQLSDFLSQKVIKREYYKMFSGKQIFPILSWGLHATVGIHQSGQIQLSNLKLHEHNGIYLHDNPDYFNCDPLAQQWVNAISEKSNLKTQRKIRQQNEMIGGELFGQSGQKFEKNESSIYYKTMQKQIAQYGRRRILTQKSRRRVYHY